MKLHRKQEDAIIRAYEIGLPHYVELPHDEKDALHGLGITDEGGTLTGAGIYIAAYVKRNRQLEHRLWRDAIDSLK